MTRLRWTVVPEGDEDAVEAGGLFLSLDADAESADEALPAFLARPENTPVYHGFQVLEDVEVDGFRMGTISALGPADFGDAFIIAPDDSRAGLVWEVGDREQIWEVCPFGPARWGVWGVEFPHRMRSSEDARRNLEALVPRLRDKWQEWKAQQTGEEQPF